MCWEICEPPWPERQSPSPDWESFQQLPPQTHYLFFFLFFFWYPYNVNVVPFGLVTQFSQYSFIPRDPLFSLCFSFFVYLFSNFYSFTISSTSSNLLLIPSIVFFNDWISDFNSFLSSWISFCTSISMLMIFYFKLPFRKGYEVHVIFLRGYINFTLDKVPLAFNACRWRPLVSRSSILEMLSP